MMDVRRLLVGFLVLASALALQSASLSATRDPPLVGFFNAQGQFGSLDWLGGRVDDGTYTIINERTFRIGPVHFRFRIVNNNTLMLTPVLTKTMIRQALAHPAKFSPAYWAVSVAYPGHTWKRVPCKGWC
jgi:hypothetical protein